MSNAPPPLLGFNNNVRHRGRIFHIQTEDSGVKNPRIVTHLFADGGRIIRTTRTEYTEHVTRPDMQTFVRNLMKEQHKGMFTALRLGELDTLLEDVCGPFERALQVSKAPPAPEAITAPPPALTVTEPARALDSDAPTVAPPLAEVAPSLSPSAVAYFELGATSLDRMPAQFPPERGTPAPTTQSFLDSNLPRKRRLNPPPALATAPPAVSRPTSRFAGAPPKSSSSIFGEGAISEQSLDEVILSYLAEDLDSSE